jgi:hypothetical protein
VSLKGSRAPLALAAALVLSFSAPASGEATLFSAAPAVRSGEYVVYRDYTWESPTWIGFLYYDEATYGAFVSTPGTASNVAVLFRTETVDGKMILTGQNIISKIAQKDVLAVNYLMAFLPDLYSWRSDALKLSLGAQGSKTAADNGSARSTLLPPLVYQKMNRRDFGGDVVLSYAAEVPLFNLRGMSALDGKPVLELVRTGRIQSGGESDFFGFTPVPEIKVGAPLVLPPVRKNETKVIDGVKLSLDDQWTMVADNTFFLGDAAALIVDTMDLDLLQIPRENLVVSLVRLFSLSSKNSWAVLPGQSVSGTAKKFRIDNLFYDAVGGTANRDIKVCIPSGSRKCTVISLSVSDVAYQANRAYFDSLF